MPVYSVGPNSEYSTIAAALAAAVSGDTIQLQSGYSTETATVSLSGITITGDATSTGIVLRLASGVSSVSTGGGAPFRIEGNDGDNVITAAGSGGDLLIGGAGNDVLDGGPGVDDLRGGTGDDTYYVDVDLDLVVEKLNEGTDTVISSAAGKVQLKSNVENLTLVGSADSSGSGNDLNNKIVGNSGANVLAGGVGDDVLDGADGDDELRGQAGNDRLNGGAGSDIAFYAGALADYTITFDAGTATFTIADLRDLSPDGTDTVTGVERFNFGGTTYTAAQITPVQTGNQPPTGTVVINGVASEGQVLTASNTLADADGLGPVSYQWRADGEVIAGATGNTLTLTQAQVGKAITVSASYTDQKGTAESVASEATAAVANINDAPTGAVEISGVAGEGQVLTASNTLADVDGLGPVSYQWRADGEVIAGATGNTLTLTQAQVGKAITVSASYTDQQGTAESVASAATVAVTPATVPLPPAGLALAAGSDTGAQDGQQTTDTTPTITGTAQAGVTVTLYGPDGTTVLGSAVAGGDGAWSVTSTLLGEGSHALIARSSDAGGNTSGPSSSLVVTIDTAAPGAPSGLALGSDSDTGVAGDLRTADVTPTLTGTAEAGATVRLYDTDGTTLLGTTTADGSGSWSVTSASLAEGDHSLTLRTTDAAGNTSGPSASLVVTIDTTAAAPGVALVNDTGSSSTDGITGDGRVAVSGLESGARWEYSTNSGGSWASGSGTGFTLAAGSYASGAIQVRQTDAAGNTSTAASLSQTQVLGAAVSVPTINPVAADDVISAAEQAAGVTITGSTDAGSSLALSIGGQARAATVAGTSWSYTLTAADYLAMGEGAETITATATDGTGNTSAAGSISLTIDTTAPGVPVILGLASGSDTGLAGDRVTTLATPAITGMAEAGATVVLYDSNGSSVLGSASAGNDGSWSITSLPLSLGDHALTVRVTDAAGNLSGPSSALTLNIAASDLPVINITSSEGSTQAVISLYQGPVAYLQYEFLGGRGGEIVAATAGNDFLNLLGGDDAANGGAGNDVLDGGTGSNFLTGGAGQDVFFLDGRSGQTTWSTITDWTAGEQLSVWGWRPGVSQVTWAESAGAEGYKGVTMHADLDANGVIDTSVTWAGMTQAQLPTPVQFDGLLWFT
jgi:hypothetical protein